MNNFTEEGAKAFVAKYRKVLDGISKKLSPEDTDLLNIRDEILAELNKVLYLFTLA